MPKNFVQRTEKFAGQSVRQLKILISRLVALVTKCDIIRQYLTILTLPVDSETSLKEEVEKSVQLPPTYETLVSRSKLAMVEYVK